jgi:DNA modification methylase
LSILPYWTADNGETKLTLFSGHVLDVLRGLPESSVQCVITSPPYWGLRDFGLPAVDWPDGWRGSLGMEPTPAGYVAHIVQVFREVRRVLRSDGTLWLNHGDAYANAAPRGMYGDQTSPKNPDGGPTGPHGELYPERDWSCWKLKPKDLAGLAWRVAFALQDDGWWLRSDIVWSKPNPMPESVTDRPTRAHEYVFLLAKSERYYYDADAIREPTDAPPVTWSTNGIRSNDLTTFGLTRGTANPSCANPAGRNKRTVWEIPSQPFPEAHFATFPEKLCEIPILAGCPAGGVVLDPFAGSGTVLLVAQRLGRSGIGIDLSDAYCQLARRRVEPSHAQMRLQF